MAMSFTKATRKRAKLRLAITGPSGSGKTWGALTLAKGLGGRIALLDTEHESASLYAESEGMPEFDSLSLAPPYAPERFIEAIKAAESADYDVLIIDSLSHEWSGVGGCLELVDQVARSKYKGNSWSAWNDITPRHRALLDAILHSPMDIIATMRSKTETAQTEEGGRKKVVKLGMKAEQREGAEYEFTTVLDLVHDGHYATASKDRTGLFRGDPQPISEATGKRLRDWLNSGEAVLEQPRSEPPKPTGPSGPITPTTGCWERIDPAREPHIRQVAVTVREYCEMDDIPAGHKAYTDADLDNDERIALWSCLDSKVRSALKRHNETLKAEAGS
jgi:AAA domain